MGLLSEAAKYGTTPVPPREAAVVGIDREDMLELKRTTERAQQLETAWHGMVRTIDTRVEAGQQRSRTIELIVCAVGVAGLVVIVVSHFYQLIPYDQAFTVAMLGVALVASALVVNVWPALKAGGEASAVLQHSGARASTSAAFGKKVTQALERARLRGTWTPETRNAFEWLLGSMEADVAKSIKDLGLTGIEERKHRRIVPRQRKVVVQTRDGRSLTGQIADISLSGLALSERLPRVAVEDEDEVKVNGRAAVIVRIWDAGVALEFKQHLKPKTFNENLVI